MRVVFRADSGIEQGTGHVMRCLTLAEELMTRGHEVHLFTGAVSIDWLRDAIEASGVITHQCIADDVPLAAILNLVPDWLVVDSYRIDAGAISAANRSVPVLAIIDGDDRTIEATLFLDQNLGAETLYQDRESSHRYLAGSHFALVRNAILAARRDEPFKLGQGEPRLVCFMGGSDPSGSIVDVVRSLDEISPSVRLTIVAPVRLHDSIRGVLSYPSRAEILALTTELPLLLADAEVVISAAGTSAWDVCTLGIPAVLIAVAENQQLSLHEAVSRGLALGVDVVAGGDDAVDSVGEFVSSLLRDDSLRVRLSMASRAAFDGRGSHRVVARMEGTCGATSRGT